MNVADKDAEGHEEVSPPAGAIVQRPAPGIIDATAAKRHYERSAGWLTRRFRTVDRLLLRLRSAGDDGTGNSGFVFSERRDDRGNEQPVSGVSFEGSSTGTAPGTEPLQTVSSAEPVRTAISSNKEDNVRTAAADIGNAGNETDLQKNSGNSRSIQRLVQRAGSPGSVDVQQAQRRYDRTGAWIARRSGLTNRLESRIVHGENRLERKASQVAFNDVRREAAMSGPDPDNLRRADTHAASADAASKPVHQEGVTSPGNRAFAWRYQPSQKDSLEAHGRVQTKRLPAQASHAASPAEKTAANNEGAPKAGKPRSTGTFRLSRKKTTPASKEPLSKDSQTSGQDFPSGATFSTGAGPLNRAAELIQPKLPEQGKMPLASKETSSNTARESMISRKQESERPGGNNKEQSFLEQGTGESGSSGTSFSAGAGPLNRADELIQSRVPEQGTMTALRDSKNRTSASPAVGAGPGTDSRDDHARSGLRKLFRKPVLSPEIKTKRIKEYEPNPDAFPRKKTVRFGSSPLSASDQMSLGNEAPETDGSLAPEQPLYISPVRLIRSRASGETKGPARRQEYMAATGHEPGTAAELQAETSLARKTDIIWRKAAQTGESRPFPGRGEAPYGSHNISFQPDTLMRQASAPAPPQPEITSPARKPETPAAEIDLDQLVEQVSRVIARRIDIEQERRGARQWI